MKRNIEIIKCSSLYITFLFDILTLDTCHSSHILGKIVQSSRLKCPTSVSDPTQYQGIGTTTFTWNAANIRLIILVTPVCLLVWHISPAKVYQLTEICFQFITSVCCLHMLLFTFFVETIATQKKIFLWSIFHHLLFHLNDWHIINVCTFNSDLDLWHF